jgi:23S rRNA (cytosine1962-C5)-methyltransferase
MQAATSIAVETSSWPEHELLDSGRGRKLERFGPNIVCRHEPKAWWPPALPAKEWERAAAVFDEQGAWTFSPNAVREWHMSFQSVKFLARFTDTSKHVGVFPEQSPHWEWIMRAGRESGRRTPRLLNLFGYTGAATLAAAAAGFAVTHVDASKPAVAWARQNQQLSGLENAPVRWILDDAVKFVKREVRRGQRYDALVMDPPSYGRGPKGELWKVEQQLPELLDSCRLLLSDSPLFVIMTLYSLDASSLMIGNLLEWMMQGRHGEVLHSELALRPSAGGPVLPLSLCARWRCAASAER